jgi:hypothetical protein
MREQFPDLYFASIVKLAQIVRIEADVKTHAAKPKTIEEVLQQVEACKLGLASPREWSWSAI